MVFSRKYKNSTPENIQDNMYTRRGFFYLCMIMLVQTIFLLVLTLFIIALGITMSIPLWVYALALALVLSTCIILYKRYKSSMKNLVDKLRDPILQGKTLEISVLGGLASLRIGDYSSRSWRELPYTEGELIESSEDMKRRLITGEEEQRKKGLQ